MTLFTRQSQHHHYPFLLLFHLLLTALFLTGNHHEQRSIFVVVEAFSFSSSSIPLVLKNTPPFWSSTRLQQPSNRHHQQQHHQKQQQQQPQQQHYSPFSAFAFSLHAAAPSADAGTFTDDEWHPRDPAYTTPQLLARVWFQIAEAGSMVRGETMTVIYPEMQAKLQDPRYLNLFMAHLDHCKDVCDHFGISTALVPYTQGGKIVGFTAKSFKKQKDSADDDDDNDGNADEKEESDEYNFDYDPMWDDGTDFEALYTGIDDEDMPVDPYPAIENPIPDDDDKIIALTKQWVQALCSDMGICPFSPNANMAGLPVGPVFYKVDRHSTVEDVYAAYWEEVVRVEMQPEKDLATTLLILPEFQFNNIELFETFSTTLTQPLAALQIEDLLQLVFFHPQWSFRDGGERSGGTGQAANYARRSPWPMINILRTSQVRAAQKGIPTGLVYKQNEKSLNKVGVDKLETMLRLRDWTQVTESNEYKVNRREYDALKIAQDYQQTGVIDKKDMSLAGDATPAANKVNAKAVEQGNLVKILQQALEKRLGKTPTTTTTTTGSVIKPLTGPETSATAMASDFLIKQLDQMAAAKTSDDYSSSSTSSPGPTAPSSAAATTSSDNTDNVPPELLAARKKHLDASRRALLSDVAGGGDDDDDDDEDSYDSERGNEMSNVMFGRSGVMPRSDDDDDKEAFQKFYG